MALAFTNPAFAQETVSADAAQPVCDPAEENDPDCPPGDTEAEIESGTQSDTDPNTGLAQEEGTITVTGSRIRSPNVDSVVPITSIAGETFFQNAEASIGDTLNDLPQLASTFSQSNPGLGIGIAGLNLLDLRGLGTARTLVLVNGRRHVAADILNNAASPDVNTIPNDLIERVDIVTGGNSAVYGSDAIAGVVNFVLRRDFDGVQIRGQAGVAEEGFGGNQYVSAMIGKNFFEDRANVTVHAEYSRQERIFGSDVPWLRTNSGFGLVDIDEAGLPNGSDGIPDRVFLRDTRSTTINQGGIVPIPQNFFNQTGAACGLGINEINFPQFGIQGFVPRNCTFIFTANGQLVPQTGTRFGSGPNSGIIGGNGATNNEGQLFSVLPQLERYNVNLLAHFQVSEAFEPFIEAKFARVNAQGNNAAPSFFQGVQSQFDFRELPRLDNPFLAPQARQLLTNALLTAGCDSSFLTICGLSGGSTLSTAERAAIMAGTYRFTVGRFLTDVGIRDEEFQRDTVRVVGGVRGNFWDDWSYEVSLNYGKFEQDSTTSGYVDRQRFVLALDSGINPATGQIQCRSQFDPSAAIRLQKTSANPGFVPALEAKLAADIAACIPYNPFGNADNSAAINYFSRNSSNRAELEQFVALGFISGDSSELFELPGGPVRFALGGEYRREKAFYQQDPFAELGLANEVVIPTFDPEANEVKEAFGEIQIPILSNTPFFEELTIQGAARVSDYGGATGTVWAYNAGATWAPIRDLRFRGMYGRAVRAPNFSETAFPQVPNFAPSFADPCRPQNIGEGSGTRAANCQAALGSNLGNLASLPVYSLKVISGSNPLLEEEVSDSFTLGFVATPRFIPGLALSVDYYNIEVENVIVSLGAQTIVNNCYDAPTLDNQFCALFQRFQGPGTGPDGEIPGQILSNSTIQAGVNFASRIREGIDIDLAYRANLTENFRVATHLIYTHNLTISNFQDPGDPDFENRVLGELGFPQDEFRWDVDLGYDAFTLGYRMRYIGTQLISGLAFEAVNPLQGRPPENADFADILENPETFYHDLRFEWNLTQETGLGTDFRFYFGVDNVADTQPPFGLGGTGTTSAIFDVKGRTFYGGFRARF